VVERLVALFRCVDSDTKIVLELLLADELIEPAGPQGDVDLVVVLRLAGDDALLSGR
jgi:hypothetical protein